MNIVTRKLIAKELYVNRWLIAGGASSGVASMLIATLGKTGFNIGALTWLTTIIALGVMLAMYGIMNERKEHSLQFVLSLPLSIADYVRAKMLGLFAVLPDRVAGVERGGAAAGVRARQACPTASPPYAVLLCVFMLANFAVVLCGALHAQLRSADVRGDRRHQHGREHLHVHGRPDARHPRSTCGRPPPCGTPPSGRCSPANSPCWSSPSPCPSSSPRVAATSSRRYNNE